MDTHVKLASVFFIALGLVGLMAAGIVFIAIAGGGVISGDPTALFVTATVAATVSSILVFFSLPPIIGGVAMLKGKSWARTFLMIVAAIQLINIPFGTILGIYALWALSPRPVTPATSLPIAATAS